MCVAGYFNARVFVHRVLGRVFGRGQYRVYCPVFPCLLFGVAAMGVVVSRLYTFFCTPLFVNVGPCVGPHVGDGVVSFSLCSVLGLVPRVFRFLRGFFRVNVVFYVHFSFMVGPSSVGTAFSLRSSEQRYVSLWILTRFALLSRRNAAGWFVGCCVLLILCATAASCLFFVLYPSFSLEGRSGASIHVGVLFPVLVAKVFSRTVGFLELFHPVPMCTSTSFAIVTIFLYLVLSIG